MKTVKNDISGKREEWKSWDPEGLEMHIGHYTKVYAKHFAALETDPETVKALDEMAEIKGKIQNETDREKRRKELRALEKIADQLLQL